MVTYHGYIDTIEDAMLLVQACRIHVLESVRNRLNDQERQSIGSGDVFVYNEEESGIKRWSKY